jgi:hypothetical protein
MPRPNEEALRDCVCFAPWCLHHGAFEAAMGSRKAQQGGRQQCGGLLAGWSSFSAYLRLKRFSWLCRSVDTVLSALLYVQCCSYGSMCF